MLGWLSSTLLLISLVGAATAQTLSVFDVSDYGYDNLERLKSSLKNVHECEWWIEVGDKLVSYSKFPSDTSRVLSQDLIYIVPKIHVSYLQGLEERVLLHNLGFAIIQAPKDIIVNTLKTNNFTGVERMQLFYYSDTVLIKQSSNVDPQELVPPINNEEVNSGAPLITVSGLMNLVSQSRWLSDVTTLATYNRYTKGTGIAAAQKFIVDQLTALKNISVTTQSWTSGSTSGVNVIGTMKGLTQPNKIVIIGAHYDSISQSPTTSAPGAEDDGSGSAAVIEMARILNAYPPACTVLFILFSGEEQGLLGSAAHAQLLVNQGNSSKVQLMHDMDMIAYQKTPGAQGQVILETVSKFSSLFPYYRTAAQYITPAMGLFESTSAWGSDHESYINRGMPALLTIDKDWDVYPYYHRTTDTIDKLTPALGFQITKLGLGAVAIMCGFST